VDYQRGLFAALDQIISTKRSLKHVCNSTQTCISPNYTRMHIPTLGLIVQLQIQLKLLINGNHSNLMYVLQVMMCQCINDSDCQHITSILKVCLQISSFISGPNLTNV
jgi:hypothetical protein